MHGRLSRWIRAASSLIAARVERQREDDAACAGCSACSRRWPVASSATPQLRIGYVPQRETLDPLYPLSAFDVALLGRLPRSAVLAPGRRPRARAHARAALAAACARRSFAGERYGALSGGQRQRDTAGARARHAARELLLLDEPTAGVDPEAEKAILELLARAAHAARGWRSGW